MARQEKVQRRKEQRRESELREAHRRAFEQIKAAAARRDRALVVHAAIEQLVDACEAFVWGRTA
jgi:hypothetical protein